jgi:hypothetical protein
MLGDKPQPREYLPMDSEMRQQDFNKMTAKRKGDA